MGSLRAVLVLLAIVVIVPGCASAGRRRPAPPLPDVMSMLSADGSQIRDEQGRSVMLRGLNWCALMDQQDPDAWLKTSAENEVAQIAAWGFNVLRMPIRWAAIEPEPGKFSDAKLRALDEFVRICGKHGIYVIINMHQWLWSERFGGGGAPAWTCEKFEAVNCSKDMLPMLYAATEFWRDRKLWKHFADTWKFIAARYRDNPAVAGYDLFNDPGLLSSNPGGFEEKILRPFYNAVIKAVREVDDRHLIFYEPPLVIRGDLVIDARVGMKLGKLDGENLVYSPHVYTGGMSVPTLGYGGNAKLLAADVETAVKSAREAGVPLWIGEFGAGSRAPRSLEWAAEESRLYDLHMLGSAWWVYGRDDAFGVLDPQGKEKEKLLDILCRPYPVSFTGALESMSFDAKNNGEFRCRLAPPEDDALEFSTTIFIPKRHYDAGIKLSVPGRFEVPVQFSPVIVAQPIPAEFQDDYSYEWDDATQRLRFVSRRNEPLELIVKMIEE
jgi:endoglycosylceramidase